MKPVMRLRRRLFCHLNIFGIANCIAQSQEGVEIIPLVTQMAQQNYLEQDVAFYPYPFWLKLPAIPVQGSIHIVSYPYSIH